MVATSTTLSREEGRKLLGGASKPSKYRATAVTVDGIRFASKHEAKVYSGLKIRERAKDIFELKLQPRFPLVVNGVTVGTYVADFSFKDRDGSLHIIDAKGVRTPVYKLKKKVFEACFLGLVVVEV
jgi:hypothetical protein